MNSYFGHGLAAFFFLAFVYAWWRKKYFFCSLFLGCALLCDYGTAFTIPAAVVATIVRERNFKSALPWLLGVLAPAFLFLAYHYLAFGSPIAVATQYTNPTQLYSLPGRPLESGTFTWPSLFVAQRLLFGPERGILFTQPWILTGFFTIIFLRKLELRALFLLVYGSLCGLLWMNAGFGGWNGGYCIGPRYLALLFPAVAFFIGKHWQGMPSTIKWLCWVSLAVSLAFRLIVLPFSNLAPEENLWTYHLLLFAHAKNSTPWLRLVIGIASALACAYFYRFNAKNPARQTA